MRIVHLQHPYIPNMGYQENYLPAKQRELGHDVHIVTTDIVPDKFERRESSFEPGEYTYKDVPTYRCRSLSYDGEAATIPIATVNKMRSLDPDIIHSHRLISFLTLCTLAADPLVDSKIVFDIHVDNGNFHLDKQYKRIGFKGFKKIILPLVKRVADAFIAVNPYAQIFLRDRLDIENAHLLPLGADTDLFYPSQDERIETRSELGIHDGFTVITSGNLNRSKNIVDVLKAISEIDRDQVRFIILGDGPEQYMQHLRSKCNALGIESQVIFHNFVDHDRLSKYYNAADVGIWPGKLGITILEAISCGLPVIVDCSEATEFLIKNDNGTAIPESSFQTIREVLEEYIDNPHLREEQAENSVTLAQEELSWAAIAEQSIEIYRRS